MPRRVNKRFLTIFAITALALVAMVGAGGFYLVYYRNNPDRLIRQAESYLQQEEHKLALEAYGKAYMKAPENLRVVRILLNAYENIPVDNYNDALNNYMAILELKKKISAMLPNDQQALAEYLDLLADSHSLNQWRNAYDTSNKILEQNPRMTIAQLYRGMAQVAMMEAQIDVNPLVRAEAMNDLMAAFQIYESGDQPTDRHRQRQAMQFLAKWRLQQALFHAQAGQDRQLAAPTWESALAMAQQMRKQYPDDLAALGDYVQLMTVANSAASTLKQQGVEPLDLASELKPVADRMEQMIRQKLAADQDDSLEWQTIWLGVVAMNLSNTEAVETERGPIPAGMLRSLDLLQDALPKRPHDLALISSLGRLHLLVNDQKEAEKMFKQASEFNTPLPPLQALVMYQAADVCRANYANLLINRASASQDSQQQEALFKEVEAVIAYLAANTQGQEGWVKLLEGKLLLLRNQSEPAVTALDQAIEALGLQSDQLARIARQQALRQAAALHQVRGDLGKAIAHHLTLLTYYPSAKDGLSAGRLNELVQLAQLYLNIKDFNQAEAILKQIKEEGGADFRVNQLEISLLAARGEADKALALCRQIIDADTGELQQLDSIKLMQVEILANSDRRDQAIAILRPIFERKPNSIRFLRAMLVLETDEDRADQWVQQSRLAGMDENQLTQAQMVRKTKDERLEFMEGMVEKRNQEPFERHLALRQIYAASGDMDKAKKHFEEAAKLKPNHPMVLDIRFGQAVSDQDWALAEKLSQKAREIDADQAGGLLYQAQLDQAQNHLPQAINHFKQAMAIRPNFSDGWRRMGDAQRAANDISGAGKSYQQCLNQQPTNTRAMIGMAAVNRMQNNYDQMIHWLNRARQFARNDITLELDYLASIQQFGDKTEALQLRRKLAEKAPSVTENRRQLALLLTQEQHGDEAIAEIDRIIDLEGQTLTNLGVKARILAILGKTAEGEQLLRNHLTQKADRAVSADWVVLARYQLQANQLNTAVQSYNEARKLENAATRPATRELASVLYQLGEHRQAEILLQELWEQDSSQIEIVQALVDLKFKSDAMEEAALILQTTPEEFHRDSWYLVLRAKIAAKKNQHDQARRILGRAVEQDPTNANLYYQRAAINESTPDDAVSRQSRIPVETDLKQAIELNPNHFASHLRLAQIYSTDRRVDEAVREWESVIRIKPSAIGERLAYAQLLMAHQRWLALETLADKAVAVHPKQARWFALRGQAQINQDRKLDAINSYRQAIELDPSKENISVAAKLYNDIGRPEEALLLLEAHSELTQNDPVLQAVRGRALALRQQHAAAASAFRTAIGLCKELPELNSVLQRMLAVWPAQRVYPILEAEAIALNQDWAHLPLAQMEILLNDAAKATQRLEGLADRVTPEASYQYAFYQMLARAYHQADRQEQAKQTYEKVLEIQPQDLEALNNLAYLLAENMAQPRLAVDYARRAADLAPENSDVLDTYGWIQLKSGQPLEATKTLRRAVALKSGSVQATYHLGAALAELAKEDAVYQPEAHTMLRRAVELAGQSQRKEDQQDGAEAKAMLDVLEALLEASRP